MQHVNGIDVSDWQGSVDWSAVRRSGYSIAYTKVTESSTFKAQTCYSNFINGRNALLAMGGYHFASWTGDAAEQAQFFLNNYTPVKGDLPPCLDCEGANPLSPGATVEWIGTWLDIVEAVLPNRRRAVLYMSPGWWRDNLNSSMGFSGHPLWLAQWDVDEPDVLNYWHPTLWQKSQSLVIPGVDGNCDWDWFLGSINALREFIL